MQRNLTEALIILAAGIMIVFSASNADAIPAFARQNNAECSTCHTIFPELNEYGEAFYKNAFVLTGDKAAKRAELPKDTKLEGILLSGIPTILPVSINTALNLAYNSHPLNNDKLDLSSRAVTVEAGGNYSEAAGFFLSYNLYTQGIYEPKSSNTPLNNTPNLNEAFLVWRQVFDTPLNIKAGRMKPKLSLWKSENKTTVSTYAPLVYRVGNSPYFVDAPEDAIEANAIIANRFFVAVGVVDRNGQNTKEGYGHVSVKIGGADFHGVEADVDFDSPSILNYTTFTLGAYTYNGRVSSVSNQVAVNSNNYYRTGIDADLYVKRFRLRATAVKGNDANPFLDTTIDPSSNVIAPRDVDSTVYAAELQYLSGSNILASFRYEYQDSGPVKYFDSSSNAINIRTGATRRYIPSIAFAAKQSIKVVLEYKYEDTPIGTNRIANVGTEFSF